LIITEPPRLSSGQPVSGSGFAINLIGGIGFGYAIQASTDMTNWTSVAMLTNSSRSVAWADADAAKHTQQFYRAIQLPGVNP